jgi:hypothetical protein
MDGSTGGALFPLFMLAMVVFVLASVWRVFTKAGKPGWASLIPIYNMVVLLEIVGRPIWWILLMFIPFVNIIVGFVLMMDMAKSFGKGAGFGLGLFFLGFIFYPLLGFGDAQYEGAAA